MAGTQGLACYRTRTVRYSNVLGGWPDGGICQRDLASAGGEEWKKWSSDTSKKILNLQNSDGTWSGHHCITGRVATTSAAILNLITNREQSRENRP